MSDAQRIADLYQELQNLVEDCPQVELSGTVAAELAGYGVGDNPVAILTTREELDRIREVMES